MKYYFNMVEVALALAIIAIGISSILVLFPVGVNANKSAIADNNVADVAEYIAGYFQRICLNTFQNPSGSGAINFDNWKNNKPSANPENDVTNSVTWNASRIQDGNGNDTNLTGSGNSQIYKYEQYTKVTEPGGGQIDVVDFAAVVRVWVEDLSMYWRSWGNAATPPAQDAPYSASSAAIPTNYARVLMVEISWPVEAKYKDREKRVFRLELSNPEKVLQ